MRYLAQRDRINRWLTDAISLDPDTISLIKGQGHPISHRYNRLEPQSPNIHSTLSHQHPTDLPTPSTNLTLLYYKPTYSFPTTNLPTSPLP